MFRNARRKVKRANSHIGAISRDSSPLSRNLYEITNGPARSVAPLANPDGFCLAYRPKEPVTDHFGPIIGDAVNNLREALEYSMNAALISIGKPANASFPISKKREDLEATRNYQKIKSAFPDAAKFILDEIRPFKDENLHLWAAAKLNNTNKHDDFVPTISVVEIRNINARVGTNIFENLGVNGNPDRRLQIIGSDQPITISDKFKTTVELKFAQGAIFEGQPIVPTLQNMSQTVAQTLDSFERFVRPYAK